MSERPMQFSGPASGIDLMQFCANPLDDPREYLHTPFTKGAKTYATNGHICVRVDAREVMADNPKAPDAEQLFPKIQAEMFPLPALILPAAPVGEVCDTCGGDGSCPHCEAEGGCQRCDGTGKMSPVENAAVKIGEAHFALKYMRMLAALPAVSVQISPARDSAMYFAFDGGDGLLMPLVVVPSTTIVATLP